MPGGYFSQFFIFFLRRTYFINAGLTGLGDVVLLNREYCDLSFLILLYAKKEEKKEEKNTKYTDYLLRGDGEN